MTQNQQITWTIIVMAFICLAGGTPALAQFETRASASTSTYVPYSLVAGDFNRDSKLDVAVVSYLPSGNVTIFLGNGDGTFRAGESYPVAVQPFYAATASSRNNGILDLVVGDSLAVTATEERKRNAVTISATRSFVADGLRKAA